jgi:RNA polymerase sigma-70 factor (ECF subfamily)
VDNGWDALTPPAGVRPDERDGSGGRLTSAYITHRGQLVRFLTRRLHSSATAEDVAQDLYLRLSAIAASVRDPKAFLFRAAANLASNHARDEARRAALRVEAMADGLAPIESLDPERRALGAERLRRVAAAVGALPDRTRAIFIMNRYDGLTQREIAQRLGVSQTAVENHMSKAIAVLTAALAENEAPPTVGTKRRSGVL